MNSSLFHFTIRVAAAIALLGTASADCPPNTKSIREQFQSSPTVVRLKHIEDNAFLEITRCSLKVETPTGYNTTKQVRSFAVVEVFKGQQDVVELPVLYDTDTGYRTFLPDRYEQADSFLAFLETLNYCYNDDCTFIELPDTEPTIYTMSDCIFVAGPWSEIDEEDRQFLRDSASVLGSGTVQTGLATDSAGALPFRSLALLILGALSFL